MKPKKALSRKVQELLVSLDEAMHTKNYGEVDQLLTDYPSLIHDLTAKCEVPLVMAIRYWDIKLVEICMRHGADPSEKHLCSKDNSKPKIPTLIAVEEFSLRIAGKKTAGPAYDRQFRIYTDILRSLVCTAPFKSSGE